MKFFSRLLTGSLLINSTYFTCRKTLYYRVFLTDNLSLSLSTSLNLYESNSFLNLLSVWENLLMIEMIRLPMRHSSDTGFHAI